MKKQVTSLATRQGKLNKQAMRKVVGGFITCCMAPWTTRCIPGTCNNPRTGDTETCYCHAPIP